MSLKLLICMVWESILKKCHKFPSHAYTSILDPFPDFLPHLSVGCRTYNTLKTLYSLVPLKMLARKGVAIASWLMKKEFVSGGGIKLLLLMLMYVFYRRVTKSKTNRSFQSDEEDCVHRGLIGAQSVVHSAPSRTLSSSCMSSISEEKSSFSSRLNLRGSKWLLFNDLLIEMDSFESASTIWFM